MWYDNQANYTSVGNKLMIKLQIQYMIRVYSKLLRLVKLLILFLCRKNGKND